MSGNGNVNTSILSLINHYTAFSETIKGNSATTRAHNAISMNNTHPSYPKDPIVSLPKDSPEIVSKNPSKKFTIAAMPAYNEEQFVAKAIIESKKYVNKVIIVDDGSSDSTAEIAEALGAIVCQHDTNKGYGAALQTIFNTARSLDADILVILDADGQHNPEDIPKLISALDKGVDVVIGSRFLDTNGLGIPTYRKAGMKILDIATMAAGGINVSDTQSGFRAYGKKAIKAIYIQDSGMSAGSEILLRIKENALKVGEVPIVVRYDLENTSTKGPVTHGLEVLNQLVKIISYRRPLWFFGLPGICIVFIGLIFGSLAFSQYYQTSKFPYLLSMLSGLGLILGLLLITSGLILNSLIVLMKSRE